MAKTRIFRVVALPTWQLPTQSCPAQIGVSYPNGTPVLAPRPMEHPNFISETLGREPTTFEPANDATLGIEDRL